MIDPSIIDERIDARAELKLLELIRSPDFYSALMRSAAEIPADTTSQVKP